MFETLIKSLQIGSSPRSGGRHVLSKIFSTRYSRISKDAGDDDYCSFMLPRVYDNEKYVLEYEMIEYSPVALKPLEQDCDDMDNIVDKFIYVTSSHNKKVRKVCCFHRTFTT